MNTSTAPTAMRAWPVHPHLRARGTLAALALTIVLVGCAAIPAKPGSATWKMRDAARVGGHATEAAGKPKLSGTASDAGMEFDGTGGGLFVPAIPIAGWQAFTIQVRFKPDGSGTEEQRFLHLE